MQVCIAQMNYNSKDIHSHVEKIKDIISRFRTHDLVIFPELALHGHPSYERPEGFLYRKMKVQYRNVSEELYEFVRQVGARVIIGELRRRGDEYFNLATYVDSDGPASYTKTHVHWTENFTPGDELMVFATQVGPVGINVCYDAAFSEVWRTLALKGAEVAVNISAVPWSFSRDYMWRRCQGAAMFNQYYVLYANRPGPHFGGCSGVFSPRGEMLVAAGPEEELVTAEFDLAEVAKWRAEEVVFPNRRPLLYRELADRSKGARVPPGLEPEGAGPEEAHPNAA
jgi:predicted amidohydrolase